MEEKASKITRETTPSATLSAKGKEADRMCRRTPRWRDSCREKTNGTTPQLPSLWPHRGFRDAARAPVPPAPEVPPSIPRLEPTEKFRHRKLGDSEKLASKPSPRCSDGWGVHRILRTSSTHLDRASPSDFLLNYLPFVPIPFRGDIRADPFWAGDAVRRFYDVL